LALCTPWIEHRLLAPRKEQTIEGAERDISTDPQQARDTSEVETVSTDDTLSKLKSRGYDVELDVDGESIISVNGIELKPPISVNSGINSIIEKLRITVNSLQESHTSTTNDGTDAGITSDAIDIASFPTAQEVPNKWKWIAGHVFSGKTTTAQKHDGVYDIDEAEKAIPKETDSYLKELRLKQDWSKLNEIRDAYIRKWLKTIPEGSVILSHSIEDPKRILNGEDSSVAVILPESEFERRAKEDTSENGERRRVVGLINRKGLIDEAEKKGVKIFDDFETALKEVGMKEQSNNSPQQVEKPKKRKEPTTSDRLKTGRCMYCGKVNTGGSGQPECNC
jgi:hypothetical protein